MAQTVASVGGGSKLKMGHNSIGTRILDVCEKIERVADRGIEFGRVQGQIGAQLVKLESWKSVRGQNVSQTSALSREGSKVNKSLNSIGSLRGQNVSQTSALDREGSLSSIGTGIL